jgi:hypothetical protein
MAKYYPKAEVRLNVPLGGVPKDMQANYGLMKALRVYRPWRPEADAIANWNGHTILVEAKIFKYMDGVSKLPVYKSLLDSTPELAHFPKEVQMELLIPAPITWVQQAALNMGIKVISNFIPDYIQQVWEQRDKYWTKEAVQARETRKQKMAEAGIT